MSRPGWEEATPKELHPGLILLDSAVDDFDVRAVVVLGRSRALVWDTLAHPAALRPAREIVGGRETVVVYSHGDWDHVWGTGALTAPADVIAHARCARRFASEIPEELERRRRSEPDRWSEVAIVPPRRVFEDALELDLGDLSLHLEELPGHTDDSAVAWIPARGVLLAGDAVETPLPVVNDPAAVPGWIDGLRRWTREPRLRLVVPSHGPVGGVELVEQTLGYLERLVEGRPPKVPAGAPPFYRRTHADNVRRMERGAAGEGQRV